MFSNSSPFSAVSLSLNLELLLSHSTESASQENATVLSKQMRKHFSRAHRQETEIIPILAAKVNCLVGQDVTTQIATAH
jgi:hypothetical protein